MGHSKTDSVVYLDPSLNTSNLGDAIIRLAVEHWFLEPVERAGRQVHRLPLTRSLDHDERDLLHAAEDVVLGGTNRLSAHMRFRHRYWNWPRDQIESCFGKLTMLGVGWSQYQVSRVDPWSAAWGRKLQGRHPWSVRDEYSQRRLEEYGVDSVHTSCPTLWGERWQKLPSPGGRVVTTLTDYARDPLADRALVEVLERQFDEVALWPQGTGDADYATALFGGRIELLDRDLAALDSELARDDTSYVGLRLHAGIHAIQCGTPALIVSVDNRAREISRSVGLVQESRHRPDLIEEIVKTEIGEARLEVPMDDVVDWITAWVE